MSEQTKGAMLNDEMYVVDYWAKYLAVDEYGYILAFESRPYLEDSDSWAYTSEQQERYRAQNTGYETKMEDWKNSLVRIP